MKLKIEQDFTDKYDKTKQYKAGKEENFTKERAEELLKDPRGLVSKLEVPVEENEKKVEEETTKNEELETADKEPANVEVPEKKSKKKNK